MFGYKAGSEAIMDFLEKGILNKLIKGASIMGCMVMGGLVVKLCYSKMWYPDSKFNNDLQHSGEFPRCNLPEYFTIRNDNAYLLSDE